MIHLATRHDHNEPLYISWYRESDNLGYGLSVEKLLARSTLHFSRGAIPWNEFLTPKFNYYEFAIVPEDYNIYNAYEDYPEAFI